MRLHMVIGIRMRSGRRWRRPMSWQGKQAFSPNREVRARVITRSAPRAGVAARRTY